jgi:hypothetical protein
MLEEEEGGDDSKLETSQEAGDEQGVVDEMVGEDVKPADAMVRVRSERPKKAPYACPHTDKPYYAKVIIDNNGVRGVIAKFLLRANAVHAIGLNGDVKEARRAMLKSSLPSKLQQQPLNKSRLKFQAPLVSIRVGE